MTKKNSITPDILIETLKRSSLKTVLIEGKDDLQIYRLIEEELEDLDIDFLPCDGRTNLLEVYKAKDEISTQMLFICDSDLWLFTSRPDYVERDLISTLGYSIENELYQDGLDFLNSLFSKDELIKKKEIIDNICVWFAHEVSLFLNNQQYDCKFSDVSILNKEIVESNKCTLNERFLNARNFLKPQDELVDDIKSNYPVKLRGKFIFQTLEKIFQERSKSLVKYRKEQLFDLVYRHVGMSGDNTKILNMRKKQILDYFNSL